MPVVIKGRKNTNEPWAVVDRLSHANGLAVEKSDLTIIEDAAFEHLVNWQQAGADTQGSFLNWEFKLEVI